MTRPSARAPHGPHRPAPRLPAGGLAVLDVRTSGEVPSPDFAGGLADLAELHVLTSWHDAEAARLTD